MFAHTSLTIFHYFCPIIALFAQLEINTRRHETKYNNLGTRILPRAACATQFCLFKKTGACFAINRSKVYHFTLHRNSTQPQHAYKEDSHKFAVC